MENNSKLLKNQIPKELEHRYFKKIPTSPKLPRSYPVRQQIKWFDYARDKILYLNFVDLEL
ncbi:hypothetical protein SAMN04488057_105301 [Cyclobacterium lianum]|uniref:Uncharacterized protein n=1 Tax=Cyclobacterium lianum TaxID=388280 RepID=A0A1M7NHM4_9BACT|nr:hypothetical protein SAMN04488057_105301 [Cyclobacterium lianum]